MKSKLKQPSYIVIGAVLAVAIGYPLCSFLPKMRAISRVRQEIRLKQEFVVKTEKMRPLVAQQKAALASTFSYIEAQRSRLVAPHQLSLVFSKISQLAKESGVTTTKFEPHAAVPYDSFRKVPVGFSVTGSTVAVQKLLGDLERLPHGVWVDGIKLATAIGEDSEATRCEFDLAVFVDNREISN